MTILLLGALPATCKLNSDDQVKFHPAATETEWLEKSIGVTEVGLISSGPCAGAKIYLAGYTLEGGCIDDEHLTLMLNLSDEGICERQGSFGYFMPAYFAVKDKDWTSVVELTNFLPAQVSSPNPDLFSKISSSKINKDSDSKIPAMQEPANSKEFGLLIDFRRECQKSGELLKCESDSSKAQHCSNRKIYITRPDDTCLVYQMKFPPQLEKSAYNLMGLDLDIKPDQLVTGKIGEIKDVSIWVRKDSLMKAKFDLLLQRAETNFFPDAYGKFKKFKFEEWLSQQPEFFYKDSFGRYWRYEKFFQAIPR